MSPKEFLGVYVTDEQKAMLVSEAEKRGISISMLTTEVLKDMLISLGYPLHGPEDKPTGV